MKRYLIAACMFVVLGAMAYAGVPAKSELTGNASYSRPDGGSSSWALSGDFAFPLTDKGHILAGPAVRLTNGEVDTQAFGALIELNLMGGSGLFLGGIGLYDPDAAEGVDEYTVDARVGFKAVVGKGGLIKAYVERTIDGYGESEDLRGVAGFVVRF